jgi:hypothetical protein
VSAGDVPEPLGDEDNVDDVQNGLESSIVWAAMSIASSGDAEQRLESLRGPAGFGRGRGLRFSAFLANLVASARAPEDRKKIRVQRGWRSTSQSSESTERSGNNGGLRRAILRQPGGVEEGNQRGNGEEERGFL